MPYSQYQGTLYAYHMYHELERRLTETNKIEIHLELYEQADCESRPIAALETRTMKTALPTDKYRRKASVLEHTNDDGCNRYVRMYPLLLHGFTKIKLRASSLRNGRTFLHYCIAAQQMARKKEDKATYNMRLSYI